MSKLWITAVNKKNLEDPEIRKKGFFWFGWWFPSSRKTLANSEKWGIQDLKIRFRAAFSISQKIPNRAEHHVIYSSGWFNIIWYQTLALTALTPFALKKIIKFFDSSKVVSSMRHHCKTVSGMSGFFSNLFHENIFHIIFVNFFKKRKFEF